MAKDRFIYGSIIMIFMNIFIRIVGFAYEVTLSKLLGAEAMGWFQIAMSTLMVFLVLTISGIPTAVTKLVAQENSNNNQYNVEKIYRTTIIFNFSIAIILSTILLFSAKFIALKVLKNEDMLLGVYLLIPPIIIISLSNVLRSYFYGKKDMITPSVAQLIEHFTRFTIVIGMISYFSPLNPLYGAIIAILGISIGEFFDLMWSLSAKKRLYNSQIFATKNKWSSKIALHKIIKVSVPLTISGFFNVALNFLNTILLPSRLIDAGYTSSLAIATFGRITGMAMPLIHLPFVVTSALVINLIPSLSEQVMLKKHIQIKSDIQLAIKATLLVSIPLTTIYVILSKPIATFLYNDPTAANFIHIMGYSTMLLALQHTFSGILCGLDKQTSSTINRIIGSSLRIFLIYILVGNPNLEIYGFFIAFFVTNILILLLDIISLRKTIHIKFDYFDILLKPLFASLFMVGYIKITTYDLVNLHRVNPLAFVFSIGVAFLAYIFILILTQAIPKDFFSKIFSIKA